MDFKQQQEGGTPSSSNEKHLLLAQIPWMHYDHSNDRLLEVLGNDQAILNSNNPIAVSLHQLLNQIFPFYLPKR